MRQQTNRRASARAARTQAARRQARKKAVSRSTGGAMMNATGAQTRFSKPAGGFTNATGRKRDKAQQAANILTPFL